MTMVKTDATHDSQSKLKGNEKLSSNVCTIMAYYLTHFSGI